MRLIKSKKDILMYSSVPPSNPHQSFRKVNIEKNLKKIGDFMKIEIKSRRFYPFYCSKILFVIWKIKLKKFLSNFQFYPVIILQL